MICGKTIVRSWGLRSAIQGFLQRNAVSNQTSLYSSYTLPTATYGGRYTITLIPGDGIGPVLFSGLKNVFKSAGVPVDFEEANIEGDTAEEQSASFDEVIMSIRRNGIAMKGNWVTKMQRIGGGIPSFNVALRHELDLYANVVKCMSFPSIITRHNDIDLVIVRENTEGEYSNLEHENVSGVIEMMKIVTDEKSRRIANFAFEYARRNNRKKVTAVHKANIMKMSDGLFLSVCREVSENYPDIEFSDIIVDNCCMQLVSNPGQFDVMVMPNLYGNIITNIGAGLIGGPGLPPGVNHGDDFHVYESGTRNSGKGIAHLNIANPMSILFTATKLLEDIDQDYHSRLIYDCIESIVTSGLARTEDIGGNTKTTEFFEILQTEIENRRYRKMQRV